MKHFILSLIFLFSQVSLGAPAYSGVFVNSNSNLPTITRLTSGSGTYSTPSSASLLRVRACGGGGGSSGGGTASGGSGVGGGITTFGTSLLTANAGAGGVYNGAGGAGGSGTVSAPAIGSVLPGNGGGGGTSQNTSNAPVVGAAGGGSAIFGGGANGGNYNSAGIAGVANTGGGASAPGTNNVVGAQAGSSGGAGGCVDALIKNPASSYSYSVGIAGTAGAAGTSGLAGAAGAAGVIEITEYYGNQNMPLFLNSVTARDNSTGVTTVNTITSKSANYTATDQDETIVFTASATLSLPAAASYKGKKYHIISKGAGITATIDPNASETACGQTTIKVIGSADSDDSVDIQSDGTNWVGLNGSCRKKIFGYVVSVCSSTPCTIYTQSGDFTSISRSGAGIYSGNYNSGTCSKIPVCNYAAYSNAQNSVCKGNGATTSTTVPFICMNSTTSALADDAFSFSCECPR